MMNSLDEIGLIPAKVTSIKHRGDVNPFVLSPFGGEKLPVFVAPMTCLLNANNICTFSQSKFEPILPVLSGGLELRKQLPNGSDWCGWTAMTLDEFKSEFNSCKADENKKHYILIDVANGHMKELFTIVKDAKQEYGDNLIVMTGNIANPETYMECCESNIDYVRVGIGGGSGCTTSVQTGIHTSLPWLLNHIADIKKHRSFNTPFRTKIIADGGVSTISRAIKCLALGADYVMMGKSFAECTEGSNGPFRYSIKDRAHKKLGLEHLYYGQSSEEGQKDRFGEVKSNPEGIAKWIPVTQALKDFEDKFEAALRSAMSYCNAQTLQDFIGKVNWKTMSFTEFNNYNK